MSSTATELEGSEEPRETRKTSAEAFSESTASVNGGDSSNGTMGVAIAASTQGAPATLDLFLNDFTVAAGLEAPRRRAIFEDP